MNRTATTISGLVLLLVALAISLWVPTPSPQTSFVMRVLVALSAGAFGMALAGGLILEGKVQQWTVKAGGPVALALVVYLINPPSLVANDPRDTERSAQRADEEGDGGGEGSGGGGSTTIGTVRAPGNDGELDVSYGDIEVHTGDDIETGDVTDKDAEAARDAHAGDDGG